MEQLISSQPRQQTAASSGQGVLPAVSRGLWGLLPMWAGAAEAVGSTSTASDLVEKTAQRAKEVRC